MNNQQIYQDVKLFWIVKVSNLLTTNNLTENQLNTGVNWKSQLQSFNSLVEIEKYVVGIVNDIHHIKGKSSVNSFPFVGNEPIDYLEQVSKAVKELESEYNSTTNSLTDTQSKLNIKEKEATDLQTAKSSLQEKEKELINQLATKQDQILNHKCDTPNNAELNQVKEELSKMTKERNKLQEQLKQQKPNNPVPIPEPQEDDKREELENNKLTLEQLRRKINDKHQEIKSLKTQLEQIKQKQTNSNNYLPTTLFIGSAFLFLGSLVLVYLAKKKKKQWEILSNSTAKIRTRGRNSLKNK